LLCAYRLTVISTVFVLAVETKNPTIVGKLKVGPAIAEHAWRGLLQLAKPGTNLLGLSHNRRETLVVIGKWTVTRGESSDTPLVRQQMPFGRGAIAIPQSSPVALQSQGTFSGPSRLP
jgi:hypothetical protein